MRDRVLTGLEQHPGVRSIRDASAVPAEDLAGAEEGEEVVVLEIARHDFHMDWEAEEVD